MKKFGLFCVVAALGCNTDQFTEVPADSNFYYVRLSPEAASLAVSQTQQLTMTAYDAGPCSGGTCTPFAPGNPLTVVQTPTFRSTDTTKVRVSSTGLVTAVGAGSANVIGTLQDLPGVTDGLSVSRVDTTIFTVTATPVSLGNLQLAGRAAGTPNSVSAASTLALTTTITDATGAAVSTVGRPQYYSSNTAVATIS
ncbi:MAG: Ig-like domain-containing protein, partial [Gemmatimonadales bacterium]